MNALLRHLLGDPPLLDQGSLGSVRAFLEDHARRAAAFPAPIDRGMAGGFAADRLGLAFAAGYQAALEALVPGAPGEARALCATEEGGAHPRAIRTTLERDTEGRLWIRGRKRWATLATEAEALLVVASVGTDAAGRNRLRIARVPARAEGVRIAPMPATPFAPEIQHAEIEIDAAVEEDAVLEGDGYDMYLKPFRTLEDVHVHGATLGYLVGVGRRSGWPEAALERLAAAIVGAQAIAAAPPEAPETHAALAGLLALTRDVAGDAALWERVAPEERARWARDQGLLAVAGRAREARRARAWERLRGMG
jgi:alkylation response protein AidB-like acyl-CoA dehydrogenase